MALHLDVWTELHVLKLYTDHYNNRSISLISCSEGFQESGNGSSTVSSPSDSF